MVIKNSIVVDNNSTDDSTIDNSWMGEVDKICKRAMRSLESTHEITVNIGKSAINCLDEMHNQSDTISRINQMVNNAIGSLSDTAKCLKDMASPVTCIISGIYDEYGTNTDNNVINSNDSTESTDCINSTDITTNVVPISPNDSTNVLKNDSNGINDDSILANFSKASCSKLDDIIDQLEFNKDTTEELVKTFAKDKHKLFETVDNVQNLQESLAKVQSAMSNV